VHQCLLGDGHRLGGSRRRQSRVDYPQQDGLLGHFQRHGINAVITYYLTGLPDFLQSGFVGQMDQPDRCSWSGVGKQPEGFLRDGGSAGLVKWGRPQIGNLTPVPGGTRPFLGML